MGVIDVAESDLNNHFILNPLGSSLRANLWSKYAVSNFKIEKGG